MKVLSKNGGGLIGLALNSADIGVAIDMSKKRILTDLTKVLADALKMFGSEWLIGEGDANKYRIILCITRSYDKTISI